MIDFASVKSFVIPEGEVQSISKNGVVVWEKQNEIQNPYARELAYIESTGTQCIDTLWNPASQNARITCRFKPTASLAGVALFGSENENYECGRLFILGSIHNDSSKYSVYLGETRYTFNTATTTLIVVDLSYVDNLFKCKFDKNTTNIKNVNADITTHKDHLKIFQSLDTQRSSMRLYYFKIYEDGTLVRHFVPVMDNNNVPCLYDKVEGKLYYNQGEGEFLYGEKVA